MVRKRLNRRNRFLQQLTQQVLLEALLPQEALALLTRDLRTIKHIIRSAQLRVLADQASFSKLQRKPPVTIPPPPRPTSVISRLNSSSVWPPLIPKNIEPGNVRIAEILERLKRMANSGTPDHCLLDLFQAASGLSWQNCVQLLYATQIVGNAITNEVVAATRQARMFWTYYKNGNHRYTALSLEGSIPPWEGDWAIFGDAEFAMLLPGAILADHFRRKQFATNYIEMINYRSLDVYSYPNVMPLFQHCFRPEFDPLLLKPPRNPLRLQ